MTLSRALKTFFRSSHEFAISKNAIPIEALARLREHVTTSPYLGKSPLVGTFETSYGYSITFKGSEMHRVLERFPYLEPFLTLISAKTTRRAMRPWWHLGRNRPNAFYLNVLLVPPGTGIGPHIDATLAMQSGVDNAHPEHVSVLYLNVPEPLSGGELRLWRDGRLVACITPEVNTLVQFKGDLTHEVVPLAAALETSDVRTSIVCEQYHFPDEVLSRLPSIQVKSKAYFESVMASQKQKGIKHFELD